MFWKAFVVALIGVFAMFDSRLLGRENFEQPLVVSTLVGLALGDVSKGLLVGATLQLVTMGVVQVGAAVPPDWVLGSVVASAFAILSHTRAQVALTVALPVAVLGQLVAIVVRMLFSSFNGLVNRAIDQGKFRKARNYHIVYGPIIYGLLYFIPVFFAIYLGTDIVTSLVHMIPAWLTDGLTLASKILPAYGFALLMSTMITKKNAVYLFIGFFIAAYGNLSVIGVAIFAVLLAIVLNKFMGNDNSANPEAATAEKADDLDDLEEL
ncbi:PTS sugar transporter subunit IIC [Lactobacillus sp. ESL0684]|uniref:PTS mannose/fructose/sorbose/N-acetylgalactosamine transporter subunit IIC n=1 Tax=unclassified Lactobacillus TaxID=2620435 RepID=UPI0023F7C0F0|nr:MULTISPECIES: PTS sugar transporter subunit IIC [unclassified Lactobacillus]WEV40044.1 PTS sugar transporter subunit IIC [Lactobacillus sp. ESL0681]WEV43416.1 PTS sugar transporter subunit IIC [Lactobacillus sp. ESL0684]